MAIPSFSSDYMEGATPEIMERLLATNFEQTTGYGLDTYSQSAREKIRALCKAPDALVHFLTGGTQTNATVIDALLAKYDGVIAADTGHVSLHEAGAIEAAGHKVLTIKHKNGKICAQDIKAYLDRFEADENRDHMVQPGMVYISHPTEYGTLYSLSELKAISAICREKGLPLYVDGARLAYALGCEKNDVTLSDLANLCDAFYIGATKCGALFGEAVVFPNPQVVSHFFTTVKQHGALLAKGRLLGLQFDTLLSDGLYERLGKRAVALANKIRAALLENGFKLAIDSPTNQIFVLLDNETKKKLESKVEFGFWEVFDEKHTVVRFATSWATKEENVEYLCSLLKENRIAS